METSLPAACRSGVVVCHGVMLDLHGASDQVTNWNRRAAALAREVLGQEGWGLGDVGPFWGGIEPIGETTGPELVDIFSEEIVAPVDGGADAIVLESMSAPEAWMASALR